MSHIKMKWKTRRQAAGEEVKFYFRGLTPTILHIAIIEQMEYYSHSFLKKTLQTLPAAVDVKEGPVSLLLTTWGL